MSNPLSVAILKQNIGAIPQKDQYFANSLLYQFDTKGSLSTKQWYWVEKLANSVTLHDATLAIADAPKQAHTTSLAVGDFTGVITLFKQAKQHLKFPHIRLQLPNGQPISLSLAGLKAKAPGTVNVTDGKPFGMNIWFGRVTPDGMWEKSHKVDAETQDALQTLLAKLAKDPARVAAAYGKLTGNCCFCNSPLSDKRSTQVGYGETCAKHFSMPWGKNAPKQELVADAPMAPPTEAQTAATINDADLGNEIMTGLLNQFAGNDTALELLRKMAKLAAAEKVAA